METKKIISFILAVFFLVVFVSSITVFAQETRREKIREKWKQWIERKQEETKGSRTDRSQFGLTEKDYRMPITWITKPGDYDFSIRHDGLMRKYIVHVPLSYDNKTPTPAVIAFHGGGGNAEGSAEYFGLNDKSDEAGFIVVYPEGTGKIIKGKVFGSWNAGRCCPPATDNNVDDVGFIRELIEKLKNNFNIDENRIYATGMSNGALMSYRLACELSDKIAAIAPSSAHDAFDGCNPTRPVPIMHFHGTEDPCAFYNGGECGGCMSGFLSKIGLPVKSGKLWDCTSVQNYIEQWRKINRCSNKTKITYQNGSATCVTYQECQDNAEVTFCTIEGMGHTWPGNTAYSAKACKIRPDGYICKLWKKTVGALNDDIDANDAMWKFFKKHSRTRIE